MDQEIYADLLRRLANIRGHVRGVSRMVEAGEDFPSVLRQIIAIQGALERVRLILMHSHITNCLPPMLEGDPRIELERALAELEEILIDTRIDKSRISSG